jgi:hypothetical protein
VGIFETLFYMLVTSRFPISSENRIWLPRRQRIYRTFNRRISPGSGTRFRVNAHNRPVSYVLCRINCDIITYGIPGYDPKFVRFSPGAVLLYIIIEELFNERRFRIFDFGGQEWDYKALLATGTVAYSKVIWFPLTAKHVSLVTAHYLLWLGWRSASRARTGCSNIRRRVANYFLSKFAKGGETLRVSKSTAAFFSCAEAGQKQTPLNRRPQ